MKLDIAGNRAASKYSRSELLQRVLWGLLKPLFHLSPRLCHGWRRVLLRLLGADIGRAVQLHPSVRIFLPGLLSIGDEAAVSEDVRLYNLGPLTIGAQATISQGAHLCGGTHDDADPALPLIRTPIRIGDAAWVCADAFVGPGVTVGEGAIVAARAVCVRDVPAWQVVAGSPARVIRSRTVKSPAAP